MLARVPAFTNVYKRLTNSSTRGISVSYWEEPPPPEGERETEWHVTLRNDLVAAVQYLLAMLAIIIASRS